MRNTYQDLIDGRLPARLGLCATDPRILKWTNSAQRRLLPKGHWWNTMQKVVICTTNSCVTLPSQIATIEEVALCHQPIPVRNYWFEFLPTGVGTRPECSCWPECRYVGRYPTFRDITGVDKKIRWISDVAADVGKEALFLGYDENGNWIRTQQSGVWKDGVVLTAAQAPGVTSTQIFSKVTDIQFPSTLSGQSWLYSFSTTDSTLIMLGHYQQFETRPAYARYKLPNIRRSSCSTSEDDSSSCRPMMIEAMCKLEFVPIVNPTDYLIISNLPATEELVVGLQRAENEPDNMKSNAILLAAEGVAVKYLDEEIQHYLGTSTMNMINMKGSGNPDGCAVMNLE